MITKKEYVNASFFAAAGMILALLAAFILVAVWIPVINPGMFNVQTGHSSYPTIVYVIGTLVCIGLIILGKVGSDRSLKIVNAYKKQKKESPNPTPDGIRQPADGSPKPSV